MISPAWWPWIAATCGADLRPDISAGSAVPLLCSTKFSRLDSILANHINLQLVMNDYFVKINFLLVVNQFYWSISQLEPLWPSGRGRDVAHPIGPGTPGSIPAILFFIIETVRYCTYWPFNSSCSSEAIDPAYQEVKLFTLGGVLLKV